MIPTSQKPAANAERDIEPGRADQVPVDGPPR